MDILNSLYIFFFMFLLTLLQSRLRLSRSPLCSVVTAKYSDFIAPIIWRRFSFCAEIVQCMKVSVREQHAEVFVDFIPGLDSCASA